MKKNHLIIVFFFFARAFSVQAEENYPFEIDTDKLPAVNKFQAYSNFRTLYGEGIKSNSEGKNYLDIEELKLGVRYQHKFKYDWFFKGDIRGVFLHRHLDNSLLTDSEIWDARFEARELYLENRYLFNDLPIGLLAGRKQLRDSRGWWFDNQLDIAQIQFNSSLLTGEVSYGGRIIDERTFALEENTGFEDTEFIIAHLDYQFSYQHHLQGFAIYQNDDFSNNRLGSVLDSGSRVKPELDLVWLGFRLNGLFLLADKSKLGYWVDFATVNGDQRNFETTNLSPDQQTISRIRDIDVSGAYGFDLGTSWKAADQSWGVAVNYAHGSGDNSTDSRQSTYIQPAIANNKGHVLGESRDRIYGNILRPELSNLQLVSVTSGWRLNDYLWMQGSYFHYWQLEADTNLIASPLNVSPNGRNTEIGNAIDLIFMGTWRDNVLLQLTLSGFHAGSAYDQIAANKYSWQGLLELKVQY